MLDDFATRTNYTAETSQRGTDLRRPQFILYGFSCLKLSDNRKEDAMNNNNDEKLITRHRVRSQGDSNVSVHYCGHTFFQRIVFNLSLSWFMS